MKQRLKKILSVCMVSVCAAVLSTGAVMAAEAEDETKVMLEQTATGLSEAIVNLTDEEIEAYKKSEDSFTVSAMEAWEGSRGEVGEFVSFGDVAIKETQGKYTVTVYGDFETADANFVYVFKDPMKAPESITIDVKLPMSVNMQRAGLNTIMGLGTVFVMLIFLSGVITLMGKICVSFEKKAKSAAPAPAPAPAAAPVVEEEEEEADEEELIAVIAAAIAAAEGTTPDGFVVRSVRKVNRRKW